MDDGVRTRAAEGVLIMEVTIQFDADDNKDVQAKRAEIALLRQRITELRRDLSRLYGKKEDDTDE